MTSCGQLTESIADPELMHVLLKKVVTNVWGASLKDAVLQLMHQRVRQSPRLCESLAGNNHVYSCLCTETFPRRGSNKYADLLNCGDRERV